MLTMLKNFAIPLAFIAAFFVAVEIGAKVWSPFGVSNAVADSETAAAPAVVRPTKVLPECLVVANARAVADHIRSEGGYGLRLISHQWEHRPPAYRGDDWSVTVQTLQPHAQQGLISVLDQTVTTEDHYKLILDSDEGAVQHAAVMDTRFGWSAHGNADSSAPKGESYTGENWRHVLYLRDAELGLDAALCWHYYGQGLPAPTPEPAASPATEGDDSE